MQTSPFQSEGRTRLSMSRPGFEPIQHKEMFFLLLLLVFFLVALLLEPVNFALAWRWVQYCSSKMIVEFVGSFTPENVCNNKYQTSSTIQLELRQRQTYLIVQMCVRIIFSVLINEKQSYSVLFSHCYWLGYFYATWNTNISIGNYKILSYLCKRSCVRFFI